MSARQRFAARSPHAARAFTLIELMAVVLSPAVVEDAPIVPLAWLCGHSTAPQKMVAQGVDKTDVPERYLPMNCR